MIKKDSIQPLILLLSVTLLIISMYFFKKNLPDYSQETYASASIKELAKHANTFYFYGRDKYNDKPSLDRAMYFSQRAKEKLANSSDSLEKVLYPSIDTLLKLSSRLNETTEFMHGRYPFYLELTRQTKTDEYIDPDIQYVNIERTLENLGNSFSAWGKNPLKELSVFTVLVTDINDSLADEVAREFINTQYKLYLIPLHELEWISPGFEARWKKGDTMVLKSIASNFHVHQVGLIHLASMDEVEGVCYMNASFSLYDTQNGKLVKDTYAEGFTRDRLYSNIFGTGGFLTLFYVSLLLICSLFVLWYYKIIRKSYVFLALLSFVLSLVVSYALLFLVLNRFAPIPSEAYFKPMSMAWWVAFLLTTSTLPYFTSLILIPKLDRFFKAPYSNYLNEQVTHLLILIGSLTPIPFMYSYFSMMHSGWTIEMIYSFVSILALGIVAIFMSSYLRNIHLAPQKDKEKYPKIIILVVYFLGVLPVFSHLLYSGKDFLAFLYLLVSILLIEGCYYIYRLRNENKAQKHQGDKSNESSSELKDLLTQAVFIKPTDYEKIEEYIGVKSMSEKSKEGTDIRYCYIEGTRHSGKGTVVNNILKNDKEITLVEVHFKPDSKYDDPDLPAHFKAVAYGFRDYLGYDHYYDSVELSRKAGNIIGKLISPIIQFGNMLVDEKDLKPANKEHLAELILQSLYSNIPRNKPREYVLVIRNTELIDEESRLLLMALLKRNKEGYEQLGAEKKHISRIIFLGTNFTQWKIEEDLIIGKLIEYKKEGYCSFKNLQYSPLMVYDYFEKIAHILKPDKELIERIRKEGWIKYPGQLYALLLEMERRSYLIKENNQWVNKLLKKDKLPNDEKNTDIKRILNEITDKSLRQIVRAAAYVANENGEFSTNELPNLFNDKGITLSLLSELEESYIIKNTDSKDDFWQFTDDRFVYELTQTTAAEPNPKLNQLCIEYYTDQLIYYFKENRYEQCSYPHLKALAQRARSIYVFDYIEKLKPHRLDDMLELNWLLAQKAHSKEVSDYSTAKAALDFLIIYLEKESVKWQECIILKFRILLDENDIKAQEELIKDYHDKITREAPGFILFKLEVIVARLRQKNNAGLPQAQKDIEEFKTHYLEKASPLEKFRFYFYQLIAEINAYSEAQKKINSDNIMERYKKLLDEVLAYQGKGNEKERNYLLGEIYNDSVGRGMNEYTRDKDFKTAKIHLFKRVLLEIEKIDIGKEIETEKKKIEDIKHLIKEMGVLADKEKIKEMLGLLDKDVIDKKGLCYTLNNFNKLYTREKNYEIALDFVNKAYDINRLVGDQFGIEIALYNWIEKSFFLDRFKDFIKYKNLYNMLYPDSYKYSCSLLCNEIIQKLTPLQEMPALLPFDVTSDAEFKKKLALYIALSEEDLEHLENLFPSDIFAKVKEEVLKVLTQLPS